jgi:ankyrin repeat protein
MASIVQRAADFVQKSIQKMFKNAPRPASHASTNLLDPSALSGADDVELAPGPPMQTLHHLEDQSLEPAQSPLDLTKPLMEAIEAFDSREVERLLNLGADAGAWLPPFESPNERGASLPAQPPFFLAIALGFHEALEAMIERDPALARLKNPSTGRAPLICAAAQGNLRAVKALLHHSDPNAQDQRQHTALSLAAVEGWIDVAELLAPLTDPLLCDENGLDPAEASLNGRTADPFGDRDGAAHDAPHFAGENSPVAPGWSRRDRAACFELLRPWSSRGQSLIGPNGRLWHFLALELDRIELFERLLALRPASPAEANELLAEAIEHDAIACARLIIPQAAPREPSPDRAGLRPLEVATRLGRVGLCEALLAADPELARLPSPGTRPLSLAASQGLVRLTALLLPHSDLFARESLRWTPVENALMGGSAQCAQLIWDRMATTNPSSASPSPLGLLLAVDSGSVEAVSWFVSTFPLESRAALALRHAGFYDNQSPLELAIDQSYWDIALVLLDLGGPLCMAGSAQALRLLILRSKGAPKALAKKLLAASGPLIFAPLDDSGQDACAMALRQKKYRLARLIAKRAFARDDRPLGWEASAWNQVIRGEPRAWVGKRSASFDRIAPLFAPWLESLGPSALAPMLTRLIHSPRRLLFSTLLLNAGADPLAVADAPEGVGGHATSLDRWRSTPLGAACARGRFNLLHLMLDKVSPESSQDALAHCLMIALGFGSDDSARAHEHCLTATRLLLPKLLPQTPWPLDPLGRGALMLGARKGSPDLVELLAPMGDPLAVDHAGTNALAFFLTADTWHGPDDRASQALALLLGAGGSAFDALSPDERASIQTRPQWPLLRRQLAIAREREALHDCANLAQPRASSSPNRL